MKRIIILLSAATLALAPFVSNAAKPSNESDYPLLEVLTCSCASEQSSEDEVLYTCGVSWTDEIANAVNSSTYGASIDVEWGEEGSAMDGLKSVELNMTGARYVMGKPAR